MRTHGAFHRLHSQRAVHLKPLHQHVSQYGNGRITHHAVGFTAHEMPDGERSLFLVDVEHRLGNVFLTFRMDERREGVPGSVRVPKGEGGEIHEITLMNHPVGTPVLSVYIAEDGWRNHRMVESRVEDTALRFITCGNPNLSEFLLPGRIGFLGNSLEIPSAVFCLQIQLRVFHTDRREAHFHKHGPAAVLP